MTPSHRRAPWNIPYQRNPFFTGREDILSRLYHTLRAENTVALSQPQGITGLGGIGKTQTVVEYAYRHREEYDAVFWVRADSVTSLTSSIIELAQILELPERNEQDQAVIVQAVLHWLRVNSSWLLIYDNIDDLSIAEPFLPKAGTGHLLFTTRAHALGGLAQRLVVQQMEPEIGALLLLRRASLLALQATLNAAHQDEQRLAQAISQELDGLPLALDQAGAYIKETPCSLSEYLERYQTRRGNLLHVRGYFGQDYPASVATTWSLSFEKISQANPAAPELLNFCAFLAPDAIPEDLLISGSHHLGDVLAPIIVDPLQFDHVCKEILRFSLFQRGVDASTIVIHRLVQAVIKLNMDDASQHIWAKRALSILNEVFPYPYQSAITIRTKDTNQVWHIFDKVSTSPQQLDIWQRCEILLPHAQVCVQHIERYKLPLLSMPLIQHVGTYLEGRGQYKLAALLYLRALMLDEEMYGDTIATAESLSNLSRLYKKQGKYQQAEALCQRALSIRIKLLGPEHPETAESLNNLAALYDAQGKYQQAELLYQSALASTEMGEGPDHPSTAAILNNLAAVYDIQGKYQQAEHLYRRALSIWLAIWGPVHPNTLVTLNNLALVYHNLRQHEQAEELFTHVLAVQEQLLGPNHPDTASSLNNLASVYEAQKKYADAEVLYQRALTIKEQSLGPEHPSLALSIDNLAGLYTDQGEYAKAASLYMRALAIREQQLGPEHPYTASSLNNLARLYRHQKRYGEAKLLYQRALAICEQTLGLTHPTTQTIRANYTALLEAIKDEGEAAL